MDGVVQQNKSRYHKGFYSIFNMVMTNGSAPHIHKIYNATFSNITQRGNEKVLDGTASITMKNGTVDNVPMKVVIRGNNTIAISLDSVKTNNHFGNTPIYGQVNNFKERINIIKMIISDPEIMKKWIPMMIGNTMQNIKDKLNHPVIKGNMTSQSSMVNPMMSSLMSGLMNHNMTSQSSMVNPMMSSLMSGLMNHNMTSQPSMVNPMMSGLMSGLMNHNMTSQPSMVNPMMSGLMNHNMTNNYK